MKIVLFALLVAACLAGGLNTMEQNGQIKFSMDVHENSPVGLFLDGIIDPRQESNNKIQTFVKLANQYIPILESLANVDNGLEWHRTWHITILGVDVYVNYYFQLYVGWRVQPGTYSESSYEVTYTPFVWGTTWGNATGQTWPAMGTVNATLAYAHAYAPIGVTLYREGKICFGGRYTVEPVNLYTHVDAALKGCEAEIIDEIINGTPIHLGCNYTAPENFTLFNVNFTDPFTGDLIPETCFTF